MLITGLLFYKSGGVDVKKKAIDGWKWVGVGYLILFFSWFLVFLAPAILVIRILVENNLISKQTAFLVAEIYSIIS